MRGSFRSLYRFFVSHIGAFRFQCTEPTTLHEVYSKYTRYPYKIGKSTTVPYNNIMVRKNFDRNIYYIGGGTKFTYWNVFPNEEKCSKYMYYLSTEGKVQASFENLYYDKDYDAQTLSKQKYRHILKKENSLKTTDLEAQNCEKKTFYSDPQENVHEDCTKKFCDLTDDVCEKTSSENFVFDLSTVVGTYDAALTVEEQSYSTVRNPF